MARPRLFALMSLLILNVACSRSGDLADAYGNFEADETVISAQMPGELERFEVEEGMTLAAGTTVGLIDTLSLHLKKLEVQANRQAVASNAEGVLAEMKVLDDRLANLERERRRAANLIQAGAATQQRLDDIEGEITVVHSQRRKVQTQNAGILGQVEALDARVRQIETDILKSRVINPVEGVVLAKLAEAHEFMTPGKPLYKIADTRTLQLRAFVSGPQLTRLRVGDEHEVRIDGPDGEMIPYTGTIAWISETAEFTPKTIQTKQQRVDLIYAVKVRVPNDGQIKIGMPGELWFKVAPR